MKNIKISYLRISENVNNSIMELSLDYPNYKNRRCIYLYELFYFDTLKERIKDREQENLKYGIQNLNFTPLFFKIDDELFEQISIYLEGDTEYEECKWLDEVSLLNAMLSIYRKDPKTWDI